MNPSAMGTYQRPVQVFKYTHLHEYMRGKTQNYGADGVLGAGAVVRDAKRSLHIRPTDSELEMKPSKANRERKRQPRKDRHRSQESRRGQGKLTAEGDPAGMLIDEDVPQERQQDWESGVYYEAPEFINKGFYVWEAVRREWRGAPDVSEAARSSR